MRAVTYRTAGRRVLMGVLPVAALVAVAAAVAVAPRFDGGRERAAAQEDTGIVVSLDMDTTDGGPCADIDSSVSHNAGDSYDVAICVEGLYEGYPIGSFGFDVLYDDVLNTAPEVADAGKGFDDNPDANLGTTRWPTNTSEGLGTDVGWDCSSEGVVYPSGDRDPATGPGHGLALIACGSRDGPWTLGDDETSGVIAVISFVANYGGTDTLTIATTGYLAFDNAMIMGQCDPNSDYTMTCTGGTDYKSGTPPPTPCPGGICPTWTPTPCPDGICPTATPTHTPTLTRTPWPTATRTPTPTFTIHPTITLTPTPTRTPTPTLTPPHGVGGRVRLPPAAIAAEASAAADGPGSSTRNGIVWAGAMAGVILLLAAGGWYARRRYGR